MKRYAFRMDKILRVRRLQQDTAAAAVAGARRDEERAADALRAARERYDGLAPAPALRRAVDFLALRDRAGHRAAAVGQASAQRESATAARAAAVAGWQDAHRRVDALERLEERRRAEHAIDARRAEDATADEMIVARVRRTS